VGGDFLVRGSPASPRPKKNPVFEPPRGTTQAHTAPHINLPPKQQKKQTNVTRARFFANKNGPKKNKSCAQKTPPSIFSPPPGLFKADPLVFPDTTEAQPQAPGREMLFFRPRLPGRPPWFPPAKRGASKVTGGKFLGGPRAAARPGCSSTKRPERGRQGGEGQVATPGGRLARLDPRGASWRSRRSVGPRGTFFACLTARPRPNLHAQKPVGKKPSPRFWGGAVVPDPSPRLATGAPGGQSLPAGRGAKGGRPPPLPPLPPPPAPPPPPLPHPPRPPRIKKNPPLSVLSLGGRRPPRSMPQLPAPFPRAAGRKSSPFENANPPTQQIPGPRFTPPLWKAAPHGAGPAKKAPVPPAPAAPRKQAPGCGAARKEGGVPPPPPFDFSKRNAPPPGPGPRPPPATQRGGPPPQGGRPPPPSPLGGGGESEV